MRPLVLAVPDGSDGHPPQLLDAFEEVGAQHFLSACAVEAVDQAVRYGASLLVQASCSLGCDDPCLALLLQVRDDQLEWLRSRLQVFHGRHRKHARIRDQPMESGDRHRHRRCERLADGPVAEAQLQRSSELPVPTRPQEQRGAGVTAPSRGAFAPTASGSSSSAARANGCTRSSGSCLRGPDRGSRSHHGGRSAPCP